MRGLVLFFSGAAGVAIAGQAPVSPTPPTLETVLLRAAGYVQEFERQLAGVVAEEHYVQEAQPRPQFNSVGFLTKPPITRRSLKSDLLLVRPEGGDRWIQFRDVFEVDGKAVRDRSERLERLFLQPSASTAGQVHKIVAESARYNVGTIQRNINIPVLPLTILERWTQPRFSFTRVETATNRIAVGERVVTTDLPESPHFIVSTEAWVVHYEEVQADTLIKTAENRDLPVRGRFWLDPSTGRVLVCELIAENQAVRGKIDVSFQSEPLRGLLVPVEMREWYANSHDGSKVEGTATYSRFRQFQVLVDEKIAPIKQ